MHAASADGACGSRRMCCSTTRSTSTRDALSHVAIRVLDIAQSRWHQRRAMSLKTFVSRIFTWWNGQTFGTQVWTALYGEFVGEDERGNRYYRDQGRQDRSDLGFERRWVIYNGYTEPTTIGRLARLDAPHRRHPADAGDSAAAAVVEAAPAEPDRHAVRLSPARLDARRGPPAGGDWRLPGLAAGSLIATPGARKPALPRGHIS